jgi:hypothetical protein
LPAILLGPVAHLALIQPAISTCRRRSEAISAAGALQPVAAVVPEAIAPARLRERRLPGQELLSPRDHRSGLVQQLANLRQDALGTGVSLLLVRAELRALSHHGPARALPPGRAFKPAGEGRRAFASEPGFRRGRLLPHPAGHAVSPAIPAAALIVHPALFAVPALGSALEGLSLCFRPPCGEPRPSATSVVSLGFGVRLGFGTARRLQEAFQLHLEFLDLLRQRPLAGRGLRGGRLGSVLRASAPAGLAKGGGSEQGQARGAQQRKRQLCLHGDLLFLRVLKTWRTPPALEAAVLLPSRTMFR